MNERLRYGVIGCGSMGREHIANIVALGGAVTAIADPHEPSREAALAATRERPQVFDHHAELLGSGLCDVVVIATPNFTHIEMMRAALATDLHILVEKPMCLSPREAARAAVARPLTDDSTVTSGLVEMIDAYLVGD